jgi:hypothetical protein
MTDVSNAINKRLAEFFQNGRAEVGLEVGADAGLSPEEYIQIPASFKKTWAYRLVGTGQYDRQTADTTATLAGKQGWVIPQPDSTRIIALSGRWYARPRDTITGAGQEVDDIYVEPHTYDDVRRFIVANTGHVRDGELKVDQVYWVHAVRFWATITGLVTGSKQTEYVYVNDPVGDLSQADSLVDRVIKFRDEALTAVAARATSWRKSNHATGGDIAAGFPRRWLTQMKWFPTAGDDATNRPIRFQLTSAFYVATHAAAVHNVLAIMAPTDEGHWACIDPCHGLLMKWEVRESTSLRMAPKTQVAGTAMVVDAMVALRMLVAEGIAPLLESIHQWKGLHNQYILVEAGGVAVGSYAAWFMEGHPMGLPRRNFNQKSSECSDLVGELGAVARTYYARSTIGGSMALDNAMQQMATETAKNRWAAMAKEKRSATNVSAMRAYNRIVGASAGKVIAMLASDDNDTVTEAVATYNELLEKVGKGIGMESPPQINASDLFKSTPPGTEGEEESKGKDKLI